MQDLSLTELLAVFTAAAAIIAVCGVRLTGLADRIADRTGLGEALAGGMLLGMATSLSGTVVSVTAALDGRASLAFANAVGGIAAQTMFLALADLIYRRANLEHASAELVNVLQTALLTLMLSLPIVAVAGPDVTVWNIHPVSLALPLIYLAGARASARTRDAPMWKPVITHDTRRDRPERDDRDRGRMGIIRLIGGFAVLADILGVAGWVISKAGGQIADRTDLSQSAVGALMTAVATSLPELVTTIAAVRRGALQLAVGGIVGGNTFDVLFLTAADTAYRDGSLYHALTLDDLFWTGTGLVMVSVLLLGLIIRERRGPVSIGYESLAIILIYVFAVVLQTSGA